MDIDLMKAYLLGFKKVKNLNLYKKAAFKLFNEGISGDIDSVFYLGWDITNVCNARCDFCTKWKQPLKEMSLEQKLKVIDNVATVKIGFFSLNGGEPFLSKDIWKVIEHIKKKRIYLNINTNGSMLYKFRKEILNSGVDKITISLDENSKSHDDMRKIKGLHDNILSFISYYNGLPKKKFRIALRYTTPNLDLIELENYFSYFSSLVDKIWIQPIQENSFYFKQDSRTTGVSCTKVEWLSFLLKYRTVIPHLFYHYNLFDYFKNQKNARKLKCLGFSFFAQIDEQGSLYSCNDYMFKAGSLQKSSIKDILSDTKVKELRCHLIDEKKRKCQCWYNCNALFNCYLPFFYKKII